MIAIPDGLPTPYLLVDVDVLERNLAAMAERARVAGVRLRPHAKTHKCAEIARRQLAHGAVGLTVATVGEAEVFADAGATDLFVAYPLWPDAAKGARLAALAGRVALRVGVDSVAGAENLAVAVGRLGRPGRPGLAVLVEVDSGHHRTGVTPDRAGAVAAAARAAGLDVVGAFTFPGHSYAPGAAPEVARAEAAALTAAGEALRAAGVAEPELSGGSTPTALIEAVPGATELRPGVYVFGDAQQVELGTAGLDDVALVAVATVVSHGTDGRYVLDAGSKTIAADRSSWASGHGRLPAYPDAAITALSEHHATVHGPGERPPLGSLVTVVPNHVCTAANLADEYVAARAGEVVGRWPVDARGRNV